MKLTKVVVGIALILTPFYMGFAEGSSQGQVGINNLQVLIGQNEILASDASKIHKLAPNLKQIHLRVSVPGKAPPYSGQLVSNFSEQMQAIQAQYPNSTIQFGFHPDNSKGSVDGWGCASATNQSQCVFSNSISFMNAVNAYSQLHSMPKFTIFSIEQSYIEPQTAVAVGLQKACLSGSITSACTVASSDPVKYGYVAPSCGAPGLYAKDTFDYGYPQIYNLYHNWSYKPGVLPSAVLPSNPQGNYTLVDAYNGYTKFKYLIAPNQLNDKTRYTTIYSPGVSVGGEAESGIDPKNVAQIYATLLTTKFRYSVTPFPCGPSANPRYLTMSGESQFLGNPGWNVSNIKIFLNALQVDLQKQGVDTTNTKFAIWSFDTMLHNISAS